MSCASLCGSEPRFDTSGEGTVQELHPLSLDRQKIRIVNMSKNGLGFVVRKAILPGTIVQLRKALEKAGVEFIPENGGGAGVRLAKRSRRAK